MALRNSPKDRYASVERFADDVRRHLNAEPVSARPDTLRYRAGKFVRRRRVGVGATALTFLLVIVLAASMSLQAGRIARERDRAEQVTTFLVELFEAFEPLEARGVTVNVAEVLRHGVDRAREELANRPLLRATIFDAIASVYELQGLHEMAEPLLEEALDARVAALGPAHLDVAHSHRRLAELRYERGNYRTESLYRAALATYRDRLDPEDVDIIRTEIGLALLLRARGSYAAADSILRQTLQHARGRDELSLDVPIVLVFLGKLRTRAADYEEAERLIREALTLRRSLLGEDHPAVANALDALGEIMLDRGDFEPAEALFKEALAIRYRLYEGDHTDIASGLVYLARARHAVGDIRAADTLLLRALPIFRRAFGEGSADFAEALEHLGVTRRASGDLESADSLFAQALSIWRAKPIEPTHDRPATLLIRIGELCMAQHEAEAARPLLTEGLALREASLPPDHWQIAQAQSLLGADLSLLERFAEAESLLIEGYSVMRANRDEADDLVRQAKRLLDEHLDRTRAAAASRRSDRAP
jgi:serine/threonine-protein kinase